LYFIETLIDKYHIKGITFILSLNWM